MKCKHFNKECDKTVINDKVCFVCMFDANVDTIAKNEETIADLTARITALEKPKPVKKVTGRKPKAKMTGQL